jgi:hypothetical protein
MVVLPRAASQNPCGWCFTRRWKGGKTIFWMTAKRSMSTKASTAALGRIVAVSDRETVTRHRFVPSQRRVPRHPASGLKT